MSRPAPSGSRSTPHAVATSTRAAASATGRPPGSSDGQRAGLDRAALAGPARHPGEAGPGGLGEPDDGGQRAGDGGEPLADEDHHVVAGERVGGLLDARVARCAGRRGPRPRCPGAVGSSAPTASPGRGSASGATACTVSEPRRTALRSRRKTIGDSSSGSRPTSSTVERRLEVGVGDAEAVAGDVRGRGRPPPRPSAGGPGSRRRWCRGRRGRTWRRRRRPRASTGRRPGRRSRRAPRPARGRRCRAPRPTTPAPARRRRRGRAGCVSRSCAVAYWNAQRPLSQFHSSLTCGSSPARRRRTLPRRWSVRIAQPRGAVLADARARTPGRRAASGSGTPRRSAHRPGRSARCCRRSRTRTARFS